MACSSALLDDEVKVAAQPGSDARRIRTRITYSMATYRQIPEIFRRLQAACHAKGRALGRAGRNQVCLWRGFFIVLVVAVPGLLLGFAAVTLVDVRRDQPRAVDDL